jgi:hypothetical protein
MVTSILRDVADPWQRLVAALLANLQETDLFDFNQGEKQNETTRKEWFQ